MRILAIETSCDETAAAVVENGRTVLSDIVASQIDTHKIYGGVVPEIASRMHIEAISAVTNQALTAATLSLDEIDAVAVTYAPGLIGALLVGLNYAKGVAYAANKPLIAVHHLRSHVAANYLTHSDLKPPFLCLIVSGGHTQIADTASYTSFKIIGKTRDDAAGEALDKTARVLGLPYPGGIHLDEAGVDGDKTAYAFPRPRVDGSLYDFSFSGLKTAALQVIQKAKSDIVIADFAASFQFAVADYLCRNTLEAAKRLRHDKIVLAGGVSANSVLRAMMQKQCKEAGFALCYPERSLCGDNAAMVGAQGYYEYQAGNIADLACNAMPNMVM
ncbi:MAG: tRNA (adenosine(37)-N6)-threonylcarbamoyltransferase complex transferase subunit TsaD [Oscillospiraceae bacterium]|jgi:N6-L-threonylcarbamoyladenine synthase|nr:tRNA (adenosine(37)-N6)-threonylcarbamoyltransferase complex transferase subunit TsaD [Oscillospiraceae bacterium]